MKKLKKLSTAIALSLTIALVTPMTLPVYSTMITQAATIALNKKAVTVAPGKTVQLNISGTEAKVTWTSSDKAVAVVDQKGKVTGKKAGKATITALVSSKKYTCAVTVGTATVAKAPFKVKKATYEGYEFSIPSTWKEDVDKVTGGMSLIPSNSNYDSTSTGVVISVGKIGMKFTNSQMVDLFIKTFAEQFDLEEKEIKSAELKSKMGNVIKLEAAVEQYGVKGNIISYLISTDDDLIQILSVDAGKKTSPTGRAVAEYMYKTIVKK